MKKRILVLLLALAMVSGVTACGSGSALTEVGNYKVTVPAEYVQMSSATTDTSSGYKTNDGDMLTIMILPKVSALITTDDMIQATIDGLSAQGFDLEYDEDVNIDGKSIGIRMTGQWTADDGNAFPTDVYASQMVDTGEILICAFSYASGSPDEEMENAVLESISSK